MTTGGYLCRCTVCGREERAGPSPLKNGWPKCCGYTMRLEDNERFKADIDEAVAECFGFLAKRDGAAQPTCFHCGGAVFWGLPRPDDPCFHCGKPVARVLLADQDGAA